MLYFFYFGSSSRTCESEEGGVVCIVCRSKTFDIGFLVQKHAACLWDSLYQSSVRDWSAYSHMSNSRPRPCSLRRRSCKPKHIVLPPPTVHSCWRRDGSNCESPLHWRRLIVMSMFLSCVRFSVASHALRDYVITRSAWTAKLQRCNHLLVLGQCSNTHYVHGSSCKLKAGPSGHSHIANPSPLLVKIAALLMFSSIITVNCHM